MEKEMKMRTMQTDKYFWKIEGVNMELEDKINKCFSQVGFNLRVILKNNFKENKYYCFNQEFIAFH